MERQKKGKNFEINKNLQKNISEKIVKKDQSKELKTIQLSN